MSTTEEVDPRDRAARWAHELAEVERVLAEEAHQDPDNPLAERVSEALSRAYRNGRDDERDEAIGAARS